MKPIISVFLFSHWGSTQLTNKRAKKVAYFIFTNTWTYILYKLFGSIFTIKYILRSENPFKCHMCSFLRDLRATWPISKSETPQGFQGTLSKMWYLRCAFYVFYLNSSCVPFIQKRQPVDPIAFIWHHHTLSCPFTHDCYLLISFLINITDNLWPPHPSSRVRMQDHHFQRALL